MATDKRCTVYSLSSSEDGQIRYIGQAVRKLAVRLQVHIRQSKVKDYHVSRWIRYIQTCGHTVQINALDEDAIWNKTEKELIKRYREEGFDLTNTTDGGDGFLGGRHSKEAREKIRASSKNRKMPPRDDTWRQKQRISQTGLKRSAATRENMSKAAFGKKKTAEHAKNISNGLTGRKLSEAHCRKISEVQTGKKTGPRSEEAKARMSASRTPEWRQRVSDTMKGMNLGEACGGSKISADDVMKIHALRAEGLSYQKISDQLPISVTQVRRIALGLRWPHLHPDNQ